MDGVINSRLYANGGCSSNLITNFPSSESSRVLESLWVPTSCVNFTDPSIMNFDGDDDVSSETEEMRNPYRQPEKKRRLSIDQVKQLEKSFEIESKLEPDRKIHLAKELGLQPRQVAIWFQNRRARFKTKQLEREYDSLKANYDSLKSDFDSLLMEKEKLQNEVSILTNKLKSKSEPQPGLIDPVLPEQFKPDPENPKAPACNQEDASSVKSDIFDSESPHCVDANETSMMDMIMVKPEQFELSPEVEDLKMSFRYGFGEVFDVHGNVSSCNLGVNGMEEQSNYWPWLY